MTNPRPSWSTLAYGRGLVCLHVEIQRVAYVSPLMARLVDSRALSRAEGATERPSKGVIYTSVCSVQQTKGGNTLTNLMKVGLT